MLSFTMLLACVISLNCVPTDVNAADTPPNIIFILTDDHGWSDMAVPIDPDNPESCEPYLKTPNLTRLSEMGMRFSQAYSPAPLCTPTRRSLQCGMTPARQRGTEFKSDFNWEGQPTIPRVLKSIDERYRCAHFGKWGEQMNASPDEAGYDVSDGLTGNVTGGMGIPGDMASRFVNEIKDDPKLIFSMTDRAINFVEETVKSGKPFYMQVSHYAIHLALQTRLETLQYYENKGAPPRQFPEAIAAMITDVDDGIGRLLDTIDELGIWDNTYLFFSTDNGGRDGFNQPEDRLVRNHPLRLAKHWLYEGGIRVPFIAVGPNVPKGSHSVVPIVQYDLLPTFAQLAGGTKPLPNTVDGGSIVNLLDDGMGKVERSFPGLIHHRPNRGPRSMSTLRVGDDKLVVLWPKGTRELYDLKNDIGESKDLSKENPGKTERLYKLLMSYLKSVDATRPLENKKAF